MLGAEKLVKIFIRGLVCSLGGRDIFLKMQYRCMTSDIVGVFLTTRSRGGLKEDGIDFVQGIRKPCVGEGI